MAPEFDSPTDMAVGHVLGVTQKYRPTLGGIFGEPKASLTEYLAKNKEMLVLLRFSFDATPVAR
jgi:hypothetical protein